MNYHVIWDQNEGWFVTVCRTSGVSFRSGSLPPLGCWTRAQGWNSILPPPPPPPSPTHTVCLFVSVSLIDTHTHARTHACTHGRTQTNTLSVSHTHTHTHTHTHAYTPARRVSTFSRGLKKFFCWSLLLSKTCFNSTAVLLTRFS